MHAVGDRLLEFRRAEGGHVAVALNVELAVVHRPRHVDRDHQLDVDRLIPAATAGIELRSDPQIARATSFSMGERPPIPIRMQVPITSLRPEVAKRDEA